MDRIKMGTFLLKLREEKGLSQADEAEILSITPQAVSKWEGGLSIPDIETLEKIAGLYHITIEEILSGGSHHEAAQKKSCIKKHLPVFIASMAAIFLLMIFYTPGALTFSDGNTTYIFSIWDFLSSHVSSPIITPILWLAFLTFIASMCLSIGNWLDSAHRHLYWVLEQVFLYISAFGNIFFLTIFGGWQEPALYLLIVLYTTYIILFYVFPSNKASAVKNETAN